MKKLFKISILAMCLTVLGIFCSGTASAKTFEEAMKTSGDYTYMTIADFMECDMPQFDDAEYTEYFAGLIQYERIDLKKYNITYDSNDVIIIMDEGSESISELTIPSKIGSYDVTCILSEVYGYFEKLQSVTLPDSLKYVGEYNFYGDYSKKLKTLSLPSSLVYFGDRNMSSAVLDEITIPASLQYFGEQPEAQINSITVAAGNKNYKVENGVLYTADGKTLVKATSGYKDEQLSIDEGITDLLSGAFYKVSTLKSVTIPKTIAKLSESTFSECANLTKLYLSEQTELDNFFIDYDAGISITLYSFGADSYAKQYCTNANNKGYKNVTYVDLSEQVGTSTVFEYVLNSDFNAVLTKYTGDDGDVNLPTEIDGIPVVGCADDLFMYSIHDDLKKKDVDVFAIDSDYFYTDNGVLFTKDSKRLIYYPADKTETIYTVKDEVLSIGDYAFFGNTSLKIVYLPTHISSFKLSAFEGCNSTLDVTVKPLSVDAASVKATGTQYNTVKLTWSAVTNVAGYKIYRSESASASGVEIADVSGYQNTVYYDKTAQLGKTYYYSIAVCKKVNNETTYVSDPCKAVKGASVLVTPKISSVRSTGYNSLKVTWNKIEGAQGYYLYRSTKSNSGWKMIATIKNGSTLTYTDTGLTCGTTYYYTIRAYRTQSGTTYKSGYVSPGISGVPSLAKPSVSSVAATSYNSLKITWTKVSGATGYYLYRSTSPSSGWKQIKNITSGSTVTYSDTGLTCGTKYYYTVRAYRTQSGTTYKSGYVSPGAMGQPLPSIPQISAISSASYTSIKITWGKISGASGYYLYRSLDGKSWTKIKTITSGSTVTYTDTGLTCGTKYYYTLRAYRTENGTKYMGGYNSIKSCIPVPATPSGLSATAVTAKSVRFSWKKVGEASGYMVYRLSADGKKWELVSTITGANVINFTDTNVTNGKTYTYTVKAYRLVNGKQVYGGYLKSGVKCTVNY